MLGRKAVVFTTLYLVYVTLVYIRRLFTFLLPAVVESDGLDDHQLGLVMSSQATAYAVSKFVSGIMADMCPSKLLLSIGLGLSGLSAIIFSMCHSPALLAVWWFVNGLGGGMVWPACAILLKSWFTAEKLGTAWSVLSTSMNVAGTLGPLTTAYIITLVGWRSCMALGGTVGMAIALISLLSIQVKTSNAESKAKIQKNDVSGSRFRLLFMPGFLGVCLSYSVITVVQYGTMQWGQLFLVKHRGLSYITSGAFMSSLEIGGIVGSLLAGYASDRLIAKKIFRDRVQCRLLVVMLFKLILGIFLYLFIFQVSLDSIKVWVSVIGFGIGLSVYGSISMYGVAALESAPDHLSGTAHSIAALFASGGQMLAGLPLTLVVTMSNWDSAFILQLSLIVSNFGYLFYRTYLGNKR